MKKSLEVYYHNRHVGTLAQIPDKRVAFQYTKEWLENGFSISPLSLPLKNNVFIPPGKSIDIFHGLYGVFSDSLPDSWGELLLDRYLISKGINLEDISILDKLAYIGSSGMGALEYRPSNSAAFNVNELRLDYDSLSVECSSILSSKDSTQLDIIYKLGGSSGGTRPKILLKENDIEWIVKFPANKDPAISGKREYDYSLCAKKCGIEMTRTELIPSNLCDGYFKTERFDRKDGEKILTLTFAGLLETDFRAPSCDYKTFMKAIDVITSGNKHDKEQMYSIMCFNILTHNCDDHTKNFSFMYEDRSGWRLAPAYDITYSTTYYGEHTTSVNGKGKDISDKDLIMVGTEAGLSRNFCLDTLEIIRAEAKVLDEYLKEKDYPKGKHVLWNDRIKEIENERTVKVNRVKINALMEKGMLLERRVNPRKPLDLGKE